MELLQEQILLQQDIIVVVVIVVVVIILVEISIDRYLWIIQFNILIINEKFKFEVINGVNKTDNNNK